MRSSAKRSWHRKAPQIIIDFEPGHISRLRDFGEVLYHTLEENGWGTISLHEIDSATTQLRVAVLPRRSVRQTAQMVQKLLVKHHLAAIARISEQSRS
jgi:hypothetical protein